MINLLPDASRLHLPLLRNHITTSNHLLWTSSTQVATMAEPRARVRTKGQFFNTQDLGELLYAFGDSSQPLSSTMAVLDEILTDFIIETCHAAALCASYSRRQKIKIDDFRWVLRKNPALLGRVNEQLFREKYIKSQRRLVDFETYGKEGAAELADLAEVGGADESDLKAGKKGRGRKKKRKAEDDAPSTTASKRQAT
ncbi:hypothetical protein AC578_1162 [Pseudocercospora eumusae]|uniref:Transcription initiation factor TFIID subunit 13 n=1 Tax=Pseudocercospora eumusae TaxID=321146 RepID=A0A139HJF7_9PEZI|nr:hypothetical protein AC578_1162 [Pseudocercospora eumusae]